MVNIVDQREENRGPSQWLKTDDLKGKSHRVVIERVETNVEFTNKDESKTKKNVAHFKGTDKRLALNWTNEDVIRMVFGDDTDLWPGAEIELFPTTCKGLSGGMVPCIRLRVLNSPPAAPATPYVDADPLAMPGEGPPPTDDEAQSSDPGQPALDGSDEIIPF